MNKYLYEYWFRYGKEEQDFDHVTVASISKEEAEKEVRGIRRCIFGIKLLEVNGIKVIKTKK